jgi:hypothetical protein
MERNQEQPPSNSVSAIWIIAFLIFIIGSYISVAEHYEKVDGKKRPDVQTAHEHPPVYRLPIPKIKKKRTHTSIAHK